MYGMYQYDEIVKRKPHLCDRCRYITFNDPDENGETYCNICRAIIDGEDDVQDVQ